MVWGKILTKRKINKNLTFFYILFCPSLSSQSEIFFIFLYNLIRANFTIDLEKIPLEPCKLLISFSLTNNI